MTRSLSFLVFLTLPFSLVAQDKDKKDGLSNEEKKFILDRAKKNLVNSEYSKTADSQFDEAWRFLGKPASTRSVGVKESEIAAFIGEGAVHYRKDMAKEGLKGDATAVKAISRRRWQLCLRTYRDMVIRGNYDISKDARNGVEPKKVPEIKVSDAIAAQFVLEFKEIVDVMKKPAGGMQSVLIEMFFLGELGARAQASIPDLQWIQDNALQPSVALLARRTLEKINKKK